MGLYIEVTTAPERLLGLRVRVQGRCGASSFDICSPLRFKASTLSFEVPDPELWWPAGYGEAALYEATVQLLWQDEVISERTTTFGIRTVTLERTDVTSREDPGEFLFRVNDTPILCKGTNWVPCRCLPQPRCSTAS